MMRLLDRYVARQFIRLFVLFSLAAPVLFILGDITDNLDTYLERGLTSRQLALNYFYQLPQFILWSVPIAALIATIFTVNGMARHSEITAAKAGGIGFLRLFVMLPVLGAALAVLGLVLSEIVPIANRMRLEALGEKPEEYQGARTDFVYRTGGGDVFSIRQLDVGSGRITGIAGEREPRGLNPLSHVVARRAVFDPEQGWILEDGYLRFFPGPEAERTFHFARMRPSEFHERPQELLADPREPEEMGYAELRRFIQILQRSGAQPRELEVDLAQKIAIPLATMIIVLFAMPLAATGPRGGAAYGVGISLGVTIVYLMLFKVAGAVGASGAVSPMVAAWTPNALFLLAAVVLLVRVRT